MAGEPQLVELIRSVRARDQDAAAQLLRALEPESRRLVPPRLTDPRLLRAFDSSDLVPSVPGKFLVRVMGGRFDLDEPNRFVRLLVTMGRRT
jgi:hypothetical protein